MKIRGLIAAGALAAGLVLAATPALAHHSFSAVFDDTKQVTLSGVVSEFAFINPHGRIQFEVKDPATGKAASWKAEVANPNALLRQGWDKNTLKKGDVIKVSGSKARDGTNFVLGRSIETADGKKLFSGRATDTR